MNPLNHIPKLKSQYLIVTITSIPILSGVFSGLRIPER